VTRRVGLIPRTFFARVRGSERVPAWAPGRFTLLGDAIHAMSPARGSGANTALMDAANLCGRCACCRKLSSLASQSRGPGHRRRWRFAPLSARGRRARRDGRRYHGAWRSCPAARPGRNCPRRSGFSAA